MRFRHGKATRAGRRAERRALTLRDPARPSRYAAFPPSPSGRFGHGPKRLHRLLEASSGQGRETGRGESCLLDRRLGVFLEVALQPPGRNPRVPARILPRDQHGELERVEQAQLRKLSRRSHGRDHIPALDRLLEDSVRTALRGRGSSSPGPEGLSSLDRPVWRFPNTGRFARRPLRRARGYSAHGR